MVMYIPDQVRVKKYPENGCYTMKERISGISTVDEFSKLASASSEQE